jgi:hypothetical protein
MVLICGGILSLFWCPVIRAVVYVQTFVLTMDTNRLTHSVVLQKFTPRGFLYAKALCVNVYNIHYYV